MTLPGRVTSFFRSATATTVDATTTRLQKFLSALPTTSWIPFTGTVAGISTCIVYLVGVMIDKHPEAVTFGMWLSFVAAWIGFGVRQFRIKRETHIQGGPQDQPTKEEPA